MDYDCLIVGGGITGLSAGYTLARAGRRILVCEAAADVGGVMRSERTSAGFLVEYGPNTVTSNDPALFEHIAELGLAEERIVARREGARRYVLHNGQLKPIPLSPPAFVRSSLLSWQAKLRLLAELVLPASPAHDEHVAAFFIRRLGVEPFERLIDPFVSGVYAGDPRQLSARAAFARFWGAEQRAGSIVRGMLAGGGAKPKGKRQRRELFSFREGLQVWPRAIAAYLGGERLWLRTRVIELRPSAEGWRVTLQREGQIDQLQVRQVVCAVPAAVTAQLIAHLDEQAATVLQAMPYPPVAVVQLGYQRSEVSHPIDGFGMLCPASEGRKVLGTLWPSALFPERAPQDAILTTSFVGGARSPALARQSSEVLATMVHEEQRALIGARGEPIFAQVTHWPEAIPQYVAGHEQRVAALNAFEMRFPGLTIAGNYRDGVSVERAWQQGREAGQRILDDKQKDERRKAKDESRKDN
jgi:protoporphyrinogen/coproporphyrinogen III oxidase